MAFFPSPKSLERSKALPHQSRLNLCSALSENRSVFGRFLGWDSGKSIDISAVGGA
jgi:hypothetical protein